MSITKPYHRNYRGSISGNNSGYSSWAYIEDKEYAKSPEHYVRAFLLIQDDLKKLFEYIEPSEESKNTYSYRIHELLMRTCIEIEANFKAILVENIYTPAKDRYKNDIYNISVYKKIDKTHHLSSYQVSLPIWNGSPKIFKPFENWKNQDSKNSKLQWYQAYNDSKHNRQDEFKKANLENLLDAVSALLIVLSSQFQQQDFSPARSGLALEGNNYHIMDDALGGYFRIKFPDDWKDEEKYDFDWSTLKNEKIRFDKIDYGDDSKQNKP